MAILTPGSDSHYLSGSFSGVSSGWAWAFSVWLKHVSDTGSATYNIGTQWQNGSGNFCDIGFYQPDSKFYIETNASNNCSVGAITDNVWYHVYGAAATSGASVGGCRTITGSYTTDTGTGAATPSGLNQIDVGGGNAGYSGNYAVLGWKAWAASSTANVPTEAQLQEEAFIIRPKFHTGYLVHWFPFIADGDYKDYSGNGFNLSEVGSTTTGTDSPPVPWGAVPYCLQQSAGGTAYTLTIDAGAVALTGQAISLEYGRHLDIGAGAITLTGSAANLEWGRVLSMGAGAVTLTGQAVALLKGSKLSAGAGSIILTGQDVNLEYGRLFSMGSGAVTITGQDVGVYRGYALGLGNGSFAISGGDVGLTADRVLAILPGAVTLTGQDVTLTYGTVGGAAKFVAANNERLAFPTNALKSTLDGGDFSISLWVWKDANEAGNQGLIGGPDYPFSIYIDGQTLYFDVVTAGPVTTQCSLTFNDFAAWHNIIAWRDGTTGEVGLALDDGTPDTQAGPTDAIYLTGTDLNLGCRAVGSEHLNGRLDEVYVWSRVLDAGNRTSLQTRQL